MKYLIRLVTLVSLLFAVSAVFAQDEQADTEGRFNVIFVNSSGQVINHATQTRMAIAPQSGFALIDVPEGVRVIVSSLQGDVLGELNGDVSGKLAVEQGVMMSVAHEARYDDSVLDYIVMNAVNELELQEDDMNPELDIAFPLSVDIYRDGEVIGHFEGVRVDIPVNIDELEVFAAGRTIVFDTDGGAVSDSADAVNYQGCFPYTESISVIVDAMHLLNIPVLNGYLTTTNRAPAFSSLANGVTCD